MLGHLTSIRLRTVAPLTTIVACTGLAIGDGLLSAITPGYDIVSETSSQLMSPDAPYSTAARLLLGIYAVLLLPFALLTSFKHAGEHTGGKAAHLVAMSVIWVHLAAALVATLALNDSDSELVAGFTANQLHDQSATIMFAAALALVVASAVQQSTQPRSLRRFTVFTMAIMLIAGSIFAAELWTEVNGILERVLAASFMLWLAVVAWQAGSSARRSEIRRP